MRSTFTFGISILLLSAAAQAQTTDDFETYVIGGGSAETIGVNTVEDTTITGTGQGPGLVNDGCTYSTTGTALQWNGVGWYGLGSRCINANYPDLTLSYDAPVTSVSFNLANFDGYGDTCTINLYDAGGSLVSSTTGLSIPDSTPVPFSWTGSGVTDVEIINDNLQWSPMIDDHTYTNGGMALVIQGNCPGPMQLSLTGATPGGLVALAYGPLGSFTIPSGPCIGTVLDLGTPTLAGTFTASALGTLSLSFTAPAALCGLSVQGVDLTTCDTSNTYAL